MTPNPEAAITCLAVSVTAAASIPVLLTADTTVDTFRPAWADHLTLRPVLVTWAALLLLLGGTAMRNDDTYDEEPEYDPAEQAAAEDGFTSLAAYLAVRPMPQQQDRRAA
ncbi:hypothetical protein [Streptomyces sp. IBSNAI001]|uniref:hypothetical protein n=1 Tax=Streptomyces sp. IBSNAI001 TaxID=3457499 RepID=UPI003FD6A656